MHWTRDTLTIKGQFVQIETLKAEHLYLLKDSLISSKLVTNQFALTQEVELISILRSAEESAQNGSGMSFLIRDLRSNKAAGMTHFIDFNERKRSLEIGGTQIFPNFQKTYVNTESKLLLLRFAIETLKMVRIYFKIDCLNLDSLRAMKRLGFPFEGVLRNEICFPNRITRNVHLFSVIPEDWAECQKNLERVLYERS